MNYTLPPFDYLSPHETLPRHQTMVSAWGRRLVGYAANSAASPPYIY